MSRCCTNPIITQFWGGPPLGPPDPPEEVLAMYYARVEDLAGAFSYTISGITIDGTFVDFGGPVDWFDPTNVELKVDSALQAALLSFGSVHSGFTDAAISPDPQWMGVSISRLATGHTLSLTVSKDGGPDIEVPFVATTTRKNKEITIVTAAPLTDGIQEPSHLGVIFDQSVTGGTNITTSTAWDAVLTSVLDWGYTLNIEIINATTTKITVTDMISDLTNIQVVHLGAYSTVNFTEI